MSAWYRRIAWLLLLVALIRALQVFASDPLLALANNYDMARIQACVDAWPVRPESVPLGANSPEAPLERYRFVSGVGSPCFVSSGALLAWLAWPGMWLEQAVAADHSFSIRWIGAVHLAVLMALAVFLTRRLIVIGRCDLAAGHSALSAIAIADPGNTIYLNTFYSEPSALIFFYALLGGLMLAMAQRGRPGRLLLVGIGLSALLLALSRIQHLLLPLVVFLAVALVSVTARRRQRLLLAVLGMAAVLGAAAQVANLQSMDNRSVRSANLVDTLFLALLPNASEPLSLLQELDLPAHCIAQSGSSWYTPGMQERELCPQVFELRHIDLVAAAVLDPPMIAKAMLGGIELLQSWIPAHLGVVEGHNHAGLPSRIPSWNRFFEAANPRTLAILLAALPLIGLLAALRRRSQEQMASNAIFLVLGLTPAYVLATSVFGDGYVDIVKHVQLGYAAIACAISLVLCIAVDSVFRRLAGRR